MTSPSRKKRPTTRPNTRQRNSGEQEAGSREREAASPICNLQSLLLYSFLVFSAFAFAFLPAHAAELKWQRPGKSTARSTSANHKPTAKFQRRHDGAVRTVAFEEDAAAGPRLTSGSDDQQPMRSVVVDGEPASEAIRSAQLPFGGDAAQPATPEAGLELEENLRSPLGDLPPDEPPLETELETPPQTEEPPIAPPDDTLRQPGEQLPPPTIRPIPIRPRNGAAPTDDESIQSTESCEESLSKLKAKTIDTVDLNIAVAGTAGNDYPFECSVDDGMWHAGRCWPQVTYLWKASALCHKPLYFEDEQLERYGHSWPPCVQPFVSGAHFFTTLPVLPYCMGVEPPTECIYALGHYRPGNCAPYMCDPIPISARGALFQAGAVVGAAAALP
jgi:hypothetical protein